MQKLIALFAIILIIALLICGGVALSIAVLVYGYGLTVVSWSWVIGGAIGHLAIYGIVSLLGEVVKALKD
jgi:hypothetical protein